jgi:ABC-type lipoprotein release transport system permease subunit
MHYSTVDYGTLSLSYKLLFRKKSTSAAILALALLVAIVASMNAIVNFINFQATSIGQLSNVGDKYLVLSNNALSLSECKIEREKANILENFADLNYVSLQKLSDGTLQTTSGKYSVTIRGVANVSTYLKKQLAQVNGSIAKSQWEANIGVILAKTCSVNMQDQVNVSVGNISLNVRIVGVTRAQTQSDNELLVPIETANYLTRSNGLSLIEFNFKEKVSRQEALDRLAASLPDDMQIVKVQQTGRFMQQSIGETLNFLAVWSIMVYFVVAAASYVVSTRLIVESEYELATLKAIGEKKRYLFATVFTYTLATALAGAFLGISLGIVGTQVASTALRWVWQSVQVTPFLKPDQVGQILLLSLAFSALGCVYPAFKSTQKNI